MEMTAGEVLGAFQIGLITANEAREKLGFKPTPTEGN